MSKSHKKRDRNQSAFSGTPAKDKPETSSESSKSEPIKLERVLLSDEFYWEVPGDVPASDRRYGMKMVPPGVPKADASSETSNPSSPITNDTEEVVNKPVAESKAPVDTTIQERNDTAVQAAKANSTPAKETNPAFVASTQVQADTINRDKDVAAEPTTESKAKVAATILPRSDTRVDTGTDVSKTDKIHHVATAPLTSEAKGESDSRTDSSQQTNIVNRKLDLKEDIPAKLRYLKEKDERSKWRPAWIALPLLLLLGGVLYEALNTEENVITSPVDEINSNDIVNTPVLEQLPVSQSAMTQAETSQVKPVYYISHVVVKGDTLWDISQKYLNDPFRYPELAKSSNITNPDLIYPGDIVTIATTQPVESGVQAQVSDKTVAAKVETSQLKPVRFITHVVVKGDTLWHICDKYLNNPFRYPEVAKLSEIKNPDLIYPGDIVRMQI